MLTHKEERWALVFKYVGYGSKEKYRFAGKYFYDRATNKDVAIRTFKTRKEARHYRDQFSENTYVHFKVVKVLVTVKAFTFKELTKQRSHK